MSIILHIIIASLSVAIASYALVRPSTLTLRASYSLIGLTLMSGVYLVWSMPAHMMHACMSGILYVTVVSVMTLFARAKLATIESNS